MRFPSFEMHKLIHFLLSIGILQMILVCIDFDPETQNPVELQREGWQAILNQFKKYIHKD